MQESEKDQRWREGEMERWKDGEMEGCGFGRIGNRELEECNGIEYNYSWNGIMTDVECE